MKLSKIFANIYIYIILLLLYLPLLVLLVFSFTEAKTLGVWGENGFSLNLYKDLFTDGAIMSAVGNTLIIGIGAALLSTLLGTLAAIGFYNMRKRSQAVWSAINQIPVVNADIVTAVGLLILTVTLSIPRSGNFGKFVLMLAHLVICTPFVVLNILPRLNSMDSNTYEAALDLGATPMRALFKVLIPQLIPTMISSFVLAFTLSIDEFVISSFLADGFDTISTYIYANAAKKGMNPNLRALSSIIFVVMLTILIVLNVTSRKRSLKNNPATSLK